VLCAKWLKCLIFIVIALDLFLGMLCDVNKVNELMYITFLSANRIPCEVLLSPIYISAWLQTPASYNPPASTSGKTSPASQVLLKGPVVGVLLVRC
jgi:hypothetical protein